MKNFSLTLLSFIGFIFVGCSNPNLASPSILQKERKVHFKEKDYKNILLQFTIKANHKQEIKNYMKIMLQKCLKREFRIRDNDGFAKMKNRYINTKKKSNVWFDISDKHINIHHYTSNFIKSKNKKNFEDDLTLGGRYGNSVYKISLPYSISYLNNGIFNTTINNNENIILKESINTLTNKPYEPFLYNISLEDFKWYSSRSIKCLN